MSRSARALLAMALAAGAVCASAQQGGMFPGIGRAATANEIAAWDIDVRPDFKGLPAGSGSVAKGQEVWEAKCASCHGVFGESNQVFNPLVGGTSAEDVKTGRVASLRRPDYPGRTTMMKLSSLSTLWDYINRAMPWSQPKSLTVEEVYAVTAYLLHLADVVPADFSLSDKNIREVQQRLPNRNGMTLNHGLWPGREIGKGRPDVAGSACMKNCMVDVKVMSLLPGFARNAHGNLAEQNRTVGAQRGANTIAQEGSSAQAAPPSTAVAKAETAAAASAGGSEGKAVRALTAQKNCTACHSPDQKLVGPSWGDIARKHAGKSEYIAGKIRSGGSGIWGAIPMPPQDIGDAEVQRIANWLAAGAQP